MYIHPQVEYAHGRLHCVSSLFVLTLPEVVFCFVGFACHIRKCYAISLTADLVKVALPIFFRVNYLILAILE